MNVAASRAASIVTILVVMILLSKSLSNAEYVDFGFWWGMAIMVGGLLLGGVSAALARHTALEQSLPGVLGTVTARVGVPVLLLVFSAVLLAVPAWWGPLKHARPLMAGVALLLGMLIQANAALAGFARVLAMRRELLVLGLVQAVLVPTGLMLGLMTSRQGPDALSALLGIAIGNATALAASLALMGLLSAGRGYTASLSSILRSAGRNLVAFTIINCFAYTILNGDFLILRKVGGAATLEQIGPVKIFFERFVLPVWLVIATASSLQVFRMPAADLGTSSQPGAPRGVARVFAVVTAAAIISAGCFLGYEALMARGPSRESWVSCVAAVGYVANAFAATLLDIFVLATSLPRAAVGLGILLACFGAGQSLLVMHSGSSGWAVGWVLWNSLLVLVLMTARGLTAGNVSTITGNPESFR
jgi:hypothetical protein